MATKTESIQNRLLPVMVVVLIVAAFMLGMMWGKVQVYEKGLSGGGVAQGAQVDDGGAPELPPEPMSEEKWNQVAGMVEVRENENGESEAVNPPVYAFGDENAPVTIVEFTDYECPFCQRFFNDTYGELKEKYVDTGKLRYVMRDLPLSFHANAQNAAIAARCVGEQGKYLEMHDMIFEGQQDWASGDTQAVLTGYAQDLSMSEGAFTSCYESGKYDDAIDADLDLAASLGASGTPTFFINGTILVGAQPMTAFENLIEVDL